MILRVAALRRVFKDASRELTVIDDLTFEFPRGSSVAVVGRSGVGKSTLLHLLAGLERPTSGSVCYGDTNLSALSSDQLARFRGENIGMIFQFHHLLPEFNALENVAMPLIIQRQSESEAGESARRLLSLVGLEERLYHRPGQLSGGEQQRVAIARALIARPTVLLADEPTGNLDFKTAKEVQSLIADLCKQIDATLIVVTHDLTLAQSMEIVLEMQPGGGLQQYT